MPGQIVAMNPGGQTNLWAGLLEGLEELRKNDRPGRHSAALVLTDGCPNLSPPRGLIEMFRRYRQQQLHNSVVHTFGFGYNMDSSMLVELANQGDGVYAFVPDSSFVGTAFVNCINSLLTVLATDASRGLDVENRDPIYRKHGWVR